MRAIDNPFSPGAGTPPPELAGRDALIEQAEILFARTLLGRSEKSLCITGLRGVGKTVLLNSLDLKAQAAGYRTIMTEAHDGKSLAALLAPGLRQLLYSLNRAEAINQKARRALAVFKSFLGAVKVTVADIEIGIDAEIGTADSGDIEADLPAILVAVAEAAKDRKTGVMILIDELQYLSNKDFSALIMSMHRMGQLQLPLIIIGAGLPQLPALAGDSKSYAERLFNFQDVGALIPEDAIKALSGPVNRAGVNFTTEALAEILEVTKCYPYFLQEWGYLSWNLAINSTIDLDTVKAASKLAVSRLDKAFFRVRFDRLTPREREYLRALAELGPGSHRSGEIAAILIATARTLGPIRDSLIKKGMVYSPAYGDTAFTVPLFDEFMRRFMPNGPAPWSEQKKSKAGPKKTKHP